jgi:hypothetical protein
MYNFWATQISTLLQSISYDDLCADVVSLQRTYDDTLIYVAFKLQRVICIEQQQQQIVTTTGTNNTNNTNNTSNTSKWILSNAHTLHSKDVKAVCCMYLSYTTAS